MGGRSVERDESGTEFIVETGYGTIAKIEWPPEGKKNAEVHFDAEGLKIPVRGWANTEREDLKQAISEALERKTRVAFRIEVHRSEEQSNDIPMMDVPNFSRFRRLEGLRVAGDATGAAPPPSSSSAVPPPDSWSYAVGMVDLAYELLHNAERDGGLVKVMPSQVRSLAAVLLQTADGAQRAVRGDVDRDANSHTRARGAVRTALRFLPPPLGADGPTLMAWAARLEKIASTLLTQASELAAETPSVGDATAALVTSWLPS